MSDLFSHHRERTLERIAPLAERLRPRSLDEFVGQEAILGPGRLLRRAIRADRVGNLILHGPPGTGKTTLARIIAGSTRAHFTSLNAVLAGVKDLRASVEAARERLAHHGLRTILFIDEVHRFNSAQQDALLPWVENGTVSLIGATTENPCFEVNKALVSRSRLFRLHPLEPRHLQQLLARALSDREHGFGSKAVTISPEAADHLVDVANGDARSLLNALELAVETTEVAPDGTITIDLAIAEESIQQRAVLYDKQGDAHFDTISAFIKSLRGGDPDAALFWLARMVEAGEDPRFVFRRMLIAAGEDVGMADPQAMVVVEACAAAFDRIGLPEGLYPLTLAATYLATAEKSNSALGVFDALKTVRQANRQEVPSHLRDAHRDGQAFGDGVGYRYPHAYAEHWVAQQYLPSALQGEVFWHPGEQGWEGRLRPRLQQRRAAQLAAVAETTSETGERLSSSPDDAVLERWLRRQAAGEGERLDRLRQRFWQDARWRPTDRVLMLEARSLLWALDPLAATPDGGMVIHVAGEGDRERLEAQLDVLDQLRRPTVLAAPRTMPQDLEAQFEHDLQFEWIAGRQPFMGLEEPLILDWIQRIGGWAAPKAQLRWLIGQPLLGPAAGLLQWLRSTGESNGTAVLEKAVGVERPRMAGEGLHSETMLRVMEASAWRVDRSQWQESVPMTLSEGLVQRWFADQATYRLDLEQHLGPEAVTDLVQVFRRCRGASLPQTIRHSLLIARR